MTQSKNLRRGGFASVWLAAALCSVPVMAANPAHVQQLKDTRSCPGCDLSGADLTLLFAEQEYSVDDPTVNLDGADLTGADLKGAFLYQASFKGARMHGADLRGSNLTGAHMESADLTGTKYGNWDIHWSNLNGTYLTDTNLTGATGADLEDANTCRTTLPDGSIDAGYCD
ncbi:pentapeptide repeat-containing protein [Parasphingorhabdus sp.]|uniref:pentapeptide repeat-containing protein n=1 Tax=Parasphingorhabdus sp. TaxID=2709688 RepID=UPI003001A019